jgi:hypothetical protein
MWLILKKLTLNCIGASLVPRKVPKLLESLLHLKKINSLHGITMVTLVLNQLTVTCIRASLVPRTIPRVHRH